MVTGVAAQARPERGIAERDPELRHEQRALAVLDRASDAQCRVGAVPSQRLVKTHRSRLFKPASGFIEFGFIRGATVAMLLPFGRPECRDALVQPEVLGGFACYQVRSEERRGGKEGGRTC